MKKIFCIVLSAILTVAFLWTLVFTDNDPMTTKYGTVWVTNPDSEIRVKNLGNDDYEIFVCNYSPEGAVESVDSYGVYRSSLLEQQVDFVLYETRGM